MAWFSRGDGSTDPAALPGRPAGGAALPSAGVGNAELRRILSVLPPPGAEQVWARARPAVQFPIRPLAAGEPAPLGASRLGGYPDLPAGQSWPTWEGTDGSWGLRALMFWAQIDLATLPVHPLAALPRQGRLLFFADYSADLPGALTRHDIFGYGFGELAGARVLYAPADSALQRTAPPIPVRVLPEALLAPVATLTFPALDELELDEDIYYDAFDQFRGDLDVAVRRVAPDGTRYSGHHQFGGLAESIQHPAEQDARESAAIDRGHAEATEHTDEWVLLLQVQSEYLLGLMFGDVGTCYWVAPAADLAAGRYDTTRFVFQN